MRAATSEWRATRCAHPGRASGSRSRPGHGGSQEPARPRRGWRSAGRGVPGLEAAKSSELGESSKGESSKFSSRWMNVPRVAYHGAPGAFSSLAARELLPECEPVACETLELVTESVAQWRSDLAILPIQNTLEGTLHDIQDRLVSCGLHIVGEVNIPVIHCLLALPGTRKEDVKTVLSHSVALAQCSTLLKGMGSVREAVFDTAYAAKVIKAEGKTDAAAIASKEAAEEFGLEVLAEDVHDKERGQNIQRYLLLARDPMEYDAVSTYKTSIVFTLDEGSGQLFKALSVFALRDMNITKIESRPLRANPLLATGEGAPTQFNYIFYLDYIGHTSEIKCQQAMRHLQEITPFFKVLGSYPAANEAFRVWSS